MSRLLGNDWWLQGLSSPGSGYFRQWAAMIERRRAVPTKVFLAAQIRTDRRPPLVIDCVVRDVSPLGARLELRDTSTLRNIFELTFDAGRTLRACHVVWRTPTDVGVEFSPGLQLPTNDDTALDRELLDLEPSLFPEL